LIRFLVRLIFGFRGMTRDEARDWAAILYTPILTVCAVGQVLVIWLGPWPDETRPQRLNFLGWTLIGNLMLIGLGAFFLQRCTVNLSVETPAGKIEIENVSRPSGRRQPTHNREAIMPLTEGSGSTVACANFCATKAVQRPPSDPARATNLGITLLGRGDRRRAGDTHNANTDSPHGMVRAPLSARCSRVGLKRSSRSNARPRT
jgi:hypothetical protein